MRLFDNDTMRTDTPRTEVPVCLCAEVWPGQGHHPECPVLWRITELERENFAVWDLASRMANEMRECDHEFVTLEQFK